MDALALVPDNSLKTTTPEEGQQLAVCLAGRIISAKQPEEEKHRHLQDIYAGDLPALIAVGQTAAQEGSATLTAKRLLAEAISARGDDCGKTVGL